MSDNTRSVIAFVLMIAAALLLSWLAGFNFDRRDEGVFACAILTLFFAGLFAVLVRRDTY